MCSSLRSERGEAGSSFDIVNGTIAVQALLFDAPTKTLRLRLWHIGFAPASAEHSQRQNRFV